MTFFQRFFRPNNLSRPGITQHLSTQVSCCKMGLDLAGKRKLGMFQVHSLVHSVSAIAFSVLWSLQCQHLNAIIELYQGQNSITVHIDAFLSLAICYGVFLFVCLIWLSLMLALCFRKMENSAFFFFQSFGNCLSELRIQC